MNILMTKCCLIVFLNDSDRGGPGHLYSPYNPCDYFLRSFLKDTVYRNNLQTLEDLKQKILVAVSGISEEIITGVLQNF
jgi:hypothetical protein